MQKQDETNIDIFKTDYRDWVTNNQWLLTSYWNMYTPYMHVADAPIPVYSYKAYIVLRELSTLKLLFVILRNSSSDYIKMRCSHLAREGLINHMNKIV